VYTRRLNFSKTHVILRFIRNSSSAHLSESAQMGKTPYFELVACLKTNYFKTKH
jgi:hypothetical protein